MMTLRLDAGLGAKDVRPTPRRNPGLISAANSTRDTYGQTRIDWKYYWMIRSTLSSNSHRTERSDVQTFKLSNQHSVVTDLVLSAVRQAVILPTFSPTRLSVTRATD